MLRVNVGADDWLVLLSFWAVTDEGKERIETKRKATGEKRFALPNIFTKAIVREKENVV